MHPGVQARLFLVMLTVSLTLIVGIMLATQWRLTQSVRHYAMEEELQRAALLIESLRDFYSVRRDWSGLRQHPGRWRQLLRMVAAQPRQVDTDDAAPLVGMARRLVLIDAKGAAVVGPVELVEQARRLPIEVDGQTVGWLGLVPPRLKGDSLRERLLQAQLRGMVWIGLFALLLAAIASALLARHFLQPIRRLNRAAQALADGRLDTRVDIRRKDEFGQLAAQFNHMIEALRDQERNRRDWLADVSHELRTPLTVLRGEIEAIQDGVRPLNEAALASLRQEIERLDTLIGDLYQLALADRGEMQFQMREVDIEALLREAAERFRERLRHAGLTLEVSARDCGTLQADPQRLHQLLANLLENSARYTQAPGTVRLTCHSDRRVAVLSVDDSAPGVPATALPRLFERLYRVEPSRSRVHGGGGLGLSMARAIAQAHGGRIEALPSPLGGLTVRVSLPHSPRET
ncbi:MAG: ATP-binding protein [Pseudomonadota bacterium]